MRGREGWRERSRARDKWGITKERVRGRLSQQKERKATQMLAIVLGEHHCTPFYHGFRIPWLKVILPRDPEKYLIGCILVLKQNHSNA